MKEDRFIVRPAIGNGDDCLRERNSCGFLPLATVAWFRTVNSACSAVAYPDAINILKCDGGGRIMQNHQSDHC